MFRLILIVLLVVTILVPRRFYRRYMQAMAALALLFIVLLVIGYENSPNAASLNDIYVMVGFMGMNAVVVLMKYMLLKKPRA